MKAFRLMHLMALLLALSLLAAACGGDEPQAGVDETPDQDTPTPDDVGETPDEPDEPEGTPDDTAGEDAYYEGETIEIIVPFGPGGTTDTQARLLGEYLSQFVEGNPRTQVVNIEGGGSILGANEFFVNRDHDGLTLLMATTSTTLPAVFGDPAAEYDLAEMTAIWGGNLGASVVHARPETGIAEPQDLSAPDTELFFGAVSIVGADLPAFVAFEVLELLDGEFLDVVVGYDGGSALRAAYEAGELNIRRTTTPTYFEEDLDDLGVVFSMGMPDGQGGLERDILVPDAPHLGEAHEMLHGSAPEGDAWEAFVFLQELFQIGGRSLWVHGDAPPEAVAALEDAFQRIVEDEGYLERSEPVEGPYEQAVGERISAWSQSLADPDPQNIEWIRNFVRDRFDEEI